ncbi:MAG TPA: anti-sigma factor, partial [Pyrinomonadaceae bacterium]|nr:anti-sigma factor [Pyrinomonadaceae bacterium]
QSFELTAAAIALADTHIDEPLPAHLEARIIADADKHFAALKQEAEIHESIHDQTTRTFQYAEPKPRGSFLNWLGWAAAAAACIALATNIYLTRGNSGQIAGPTATPTPAVQEKLTPAQQRDQLIAAATDVTRAEWSKGNMPELASVSGDVVWSDAKQTGYLKLKGLPVNDANKEAYQLWIFDETQSDKTPIDGGVFNVTADGEVVIPIDAKLRARNPKAFAITIEQPGGVVVSDRKKVAGLAPVKPNQA